jgi:hypothetical protein
VAVVKTMARGHTGVSHAICSYTFVLFFLFFFVYNDGSGAIAVFLAVIHLIDVRLFYLKFLLNG